MKRLSVGQIIETMNMGGAENLVVRMANYLAIEGHDSHLIILTHEGVLSERVESGVTVHYLGFRRASIRNPFLFLSSVWGGFRLLDELIKEQGIQVVQTHLPGSNFMGLLLELRRTCPVLATIHNNEEFRYGDIDSSFLIRLRKIAYSMLLKRGHGILAVSDDVRTSMIQQLKCSPGDAKKISVVTNAVPLPGPLSSEEMAHLKEDLGIISEVPVILAAGRLSEQKNFKELVSVAKLLDDAGVDYQMLIVGEGELRSELETQISGLGIEKKVILTGLLSNLNQVMQVSDVFVMSSLWEGLPLVLLEAMAAGLPTVAFAIPGIDEVIEEGLQGFKVPVSDKVKMAEAISKMISNNELRRIMGISAVDRIKQKFSFSVLISQLIDLYEGALLE